MFYPKFVSKYKISQNTFITTHLPPQIPNQNANISNKWYIQTHESTKLHTYLHSQNLNFQTQTIKSTNLNQTKGEGYFGHRLKQWQGAERTQKKRVESELVRQMGSWHLRRSGEVGRKEGLRGTASGGLREWEWEWGYDTWGWVVLAVTHELEEGGSGWESFEKSEVRLIRFWEWR